MEQLENNKYNIDKNCLSFSVIMDGNITLSSLMEGNTTLSRLMEGNTTLFSLMEGNTTGSSLTEGNTTHSSLMEENTTVFNLMDGNTTLYSLMEKGNMSELKPSGTEYEERHVVFNSVVVALSMISTICCLTSLRIITKCQRMPAPVKYLSSNFIICFTMIEIIILFHSVVMLIWGHKYYRLIFDSRIFFCTTCLSVMWCSLGSLTYERLIALVKPLAYVKLATKRRIFLVIILIWVVNALVPVIIYGVTGIRICGDFDQIRLCDVYNLFRPIKFVLACLMITYAALIIIAYTKILTIIFHHHQVTKSPPLNQSLSNLVKWQTNLRSTKTIAAIIFAFIILQSPFFFHIVVFEFRPDFRNQNWRVILQLIDYASNQLNLYASLYLYIWQFRECKMKFYLMFSKWNKKFQERANILRIEIFNIVTIEPSYSKGTQQSSV